MRNVDALELCQEQNWMCCEIHTLVLLLLFEISPGGISQNTKNRDETGGGKNVRPVSSAKSNSCSSHSSSDQSIHLQKGSIQLTKQDRLSDLCITKKKKEKEIMNGANPITLASISLKATVSQSKDTTHYT